MEGWWKDGNAGVYVEALSGPLGCPAVFNPFRALRIVVSLIRHNTKTRISQLKSTRCIESPHPNNHVFSPKLVFKELAYHFTYPTSKYSYITIHVPTKVTKSTCWFHASFILQESLNGCDKTPVHRLYRNNSSVTEGNQSSGKLWINSWYSPLF